MAEDDDISDMEAAFISIPLKGGFAYNTWKQGIDCVLPKKQGILEADKLRTIVLFEAEFNFLNKVIARRAMKIAENAQALANEQYGSRKNHTAIEQVLNKRLSFDLMRQMKRAGTIVPTDLKGCYDRIVHSVALLCLQRVGIHESEVVCMFTGLQDMEHLIRSAYGTSEMGYNNDLWVVPMQGICQGHGAGPAIWALVSTPILQVMKAQGCGTFFKASISGTEIRLVGYAFVDDTDLIQTGKTSGESIQQIIERTQQSLDLWEGLIHSTGGAMRVDKSCWWAVDFFWLPNGTWRYKTLQEIQGNLTAFHNNQEKREVRALSIDESYETLGVKLNGIGKDHDEYEVRLKKSKKWAARLRTSTIRKQETSSALKGTILKSMEYPLPVVFFSASQHQKLMSTILQAALPKARFNRHTCRRTVYGPGCLGGLEIHNTRTTQLLSHMEIVLKLGPSVNLGGQLLRASIEAMKLELGKPGDLFTKNFKRHSFLTTDCWVKEAWKEFYTAGINIAENTPHLSLQRENDIFLNLLFEEKYNSQSLLNKLNRIRVRLGISTLSDITSGDGRHIFQEAFEDQQFLKNHSYEWPNQGPLPDQDWMLWRRAVKGCIPFDSARRLSKPLGKWFRRPNSHQAWHDPISKTTYIRQDQRWRRFKHKRQYLASKTEYQELRTVDRLPRVVFPAKAWLNRGTLHFYGFSRIITQTHNQSTSL